MIAKAVTVAMKDGAVKKLETAMTLVDLARRLRADAHLNRAQEIFFEALEGRGDWPIETAKLAKALGFAATVYRQGVPGWSAMPESLRG
jgi:hypothetical protein